MKKYLLGLYEKSMPNTLSIKEKLQTAKSAGFDYVELSIDESDEKQARLDYTIEEINHIRKAIEEVDCPIHSICLSGHRKYPLGSLDKETEKKSLEIMEKAIILAYRLGIRYIQIAGYDVYYSKSSAETKEKFLVNLKKSVDMAATYGVTLGFETMETDFMNTITKAMYYVNEVHSPYLQVYPDIGNVTNALKNDPESMLYDINMGRGHFIAAHLKETKPQIFRNLFYGEGYTNYKFWITEMIKSGVHLFVGEFWYLENDDWKEKLVKANKFLRKKINEVMDSE